MQIDEIKVGNNVDSYLNLTPIGFVICLRILVSLPYKVGGTEDILLPVLSIIMNVNNLCTIKYLPECARISQHSTNFGAILKYTRECTDDPEFIFLIASTMRGSTGSASARSCWATFYP
jgi:hypothetical protein